MEKLYLLYRVKEPTLPYAYSRDKKVIEGFLSQRNPSCFLRKTKKFETETEFFLYSNQHLQFLKQRLIGSFPYENEQGEVTELYATYEEDDKITEAIERMERDIECIEKTLRKYPLQRKYRNAVRRLIEVDDGDGHLQVDTLQLFIDLFKETFFQTHTKEEDEFPVCPLDEL